MLKAVRLLDDPTSVRIYIGRRVSPDHQASKLRHFAGPVLRTAECRRMKGVGTALVRSFVDQATRHASACVGEFTSGAAQTIAKRLGFEIYSEIPYKQIGWKEIKFRIFETCYPENYSLACMGFAAPLPRIDRMVPPPPTPTEKSTKKRTNTKDKKKRVKKR
ncbi:hypothetical protein WN55_07051 [Dufourea novaeangliae]|uniref:Uncharacterized protein n=1 Tax=Dufourea novaeangliae TaxID=178035 RepID=A0A154PSB1_DUFNO|nr:hypothetical protein WN55_07051 [Dufourea novaeangliae]